MGRPPCCDQNGLKKGPWTPEEDIALVSYIQQHGPGNWRSVPANTVTVKISISSDVVHAKAMASDKLIGLMGIVWAAIASYLPQRTDNDIKNYWNSHLKKKQTKLGHGLNAQTHDQDDSKGGTQTSIYRGQWERRLQTDIHTAKQALCNALSVNSKPTNGALDHKASPAPYQVASTLFGNYASSTNNISRLLQAWMKKRTPQPNSSENDLRTTAHHARYPENIIVNGSYSSDDHNSNMFSGFSSSSDASQSMELQNVKTLTHTHQHPSPTLRGVRPAGVPYGAAEEPPALKCFEKWLLDDGGLVATAAGLDVDFMPMPWPLGEDLPRF
ncbi:hypothetical protein SAY86_009975 [Trapa natans]|uniref:Uncharacterized protein n=1 Tax=Trapa natans TaxID=22666 RepID=A0AAN7QTF4_TRANT|nr:hypothetical protein SAY86_009975 [Trapa natans]